MVKRLIDDVKRIIIVRKAQGWSQEKTAHEIGVSLATYRRWEHGECKPGNDAMRGLIQTFLRKNET